MGSRTKRLRRMVRPVYLLPDHIRAIANSFGIQAPRVVVEVPPRHASSSAFPTRVNTGGRLVRLRNPGHARARAEDELRKGSRYEPEEEVDEP